MTRKLALSASYRIILQTAYRRMPWKNGLGETLQIHTGEDQHGQRFRLSQAAVVDDGLFSDFQGLHRTLVLLSGKGIVLSHSGTAANSREHQLRAILDMARFAGGDKTTAKLINGRIEDLNIMVRATDTRGDVAACFAPRTIRLALDARCLLRAFYANQACTIVLDTTEKLQLPAHSFLLIKQARQFDLSQGSGVFIQILAT